MTCPHCGEVIVRKTNKAEGKYKEDVERAWKAIGTLERVLTQSHDDWTRNGLVQTSTSFGVFRNAVGLEIKRLLAVVDQPSKLYAIYRRADKKTPLNYGIEEIQ